MYHCNYISISATLKWVNLHLKWKKLWDFYQEKKLFIKDYPFKITQHPDYNLAQPIQGSDIAVYHVSNPEVSYFLLFFISLSIVITLLTIVRAIVDALSCSQSQQQKIVCYFLLIAFSLTLKIVKTKLLCQILHSIENIVFSKQYFLSQLKIVKELPTEILC